MIDVEEKGNGMRGGEAYDDSESKDGRGGGIDIGVG